MSRKTQAKYAKRMASMRSNDEKLAWRTIGFLLVCFVLSTLGSRLIGLPFKLTFVLVFSFFVISILILVQNKLQKLNEHLSKSPQSLNPETKKQSELEQIYEDMDLPAQRN